MNQYEHLPLPIFQGDLPRQTRGGGGGFKPPEGRNKTQFVATTIGMADAITNSYREVKQKFANSIDPALIYEIEINQGVSPTVFEPILTGMGIHILSVAENKKGFWVVFADDDNLDKFRTKLQTYGSETGPNYDFFNAINSIRDIPILDKIGKRLQEKPLIDTAEFIDIELWPLADMQRNEKFINQLRQKYPETAVFHITDKLFTKSFVLLRVKLTKVIFDEIINLKEIARADRPSVPMFNPYSLVNVDLSQLDIQAPNENAAGILIIDSGVVSNHPLLASCIGGEENFQTGEEQIQDTVGHGTAVAGCAAYGDIEKCVADRRFAPDNWIFSAKVMYAEVNTITGAISAMYDPEKLVEHQLKDAVESFISNPDYHIKVVNISLGNCNEVWHTHYTRQLPLAALIDELAFAYPGVTFIVSAGNLHPAAQYSTIEEIVEKYPSYFIEDPSYRIINPATAALALTIGSIAGNPRARAQTFGDEEIRTPIAEEHQPSPFTRAGPGINHMVKPELVEYGGNNILINKHGHITDDVGGKLVLLNNQVTENILRFDNGTSFSAPKVSNIAGKIANRFPQRSANFINNMLLSSAVYPYTPNNTFYTTENVNWLENHISVCGYGLPNYDRAILSFDNRTVLFDEGNLGLNKVKVYSLQLPDVFFQENGKKLIIVTLTFNPETRSTRGDSYLGNRMEFHLFHSINPQILVEKYGFITEGIEQQGVPDDLKRYEIDLKPGMNMRKAGCHQKAWKEYKREPQSRPTTPVSLVLLNFNKWVNDVNRMQEYCISVVFEHEKEIELYNAIRANIQTRARVR